MFISHLHRARRRRVWLTSFLELDWAFSHFLFCPLFLFFPLCFLHWVFETEKTAFLVLSSFFLFIWVSSRSMLLGSVLCDFISVKMFLCSCENWMGVGSGRSGGCRCICSSTCMCGDVLFGQSRAPRDFWCDVRVRGAEIPPLVCYSAEASSI